MSKAKTVLVIGATGVLGSTIADVLSSQQWEVLRGGRKQSGVPRAVQLDLNEPGTVAAAIRQADLTISTVEDPRLVAEQIAFEQGGVIVNVSTLDPRHAVSLRETNPRALGTVVMNAGLAPGVTNLVASDLVSQYPSATGVDIAMTFSSKGMSGRAGIEFVHRNLTHFGGGRRGRHGTAEISFPKPLGRRKCIGFAEEQQGWARSPVSDGREIRTYACFDSKPLNAGIRALNGLGLLGLLPKGPFMSGVSTVPAEPTTEDVCHWVGVRSGDDLLAARTVECSGDYRGTANTVAVIANALAAQDPATRQRGCFGLEEIFALSDLQDELAAVGVSIVDQGPFKNKSLKASKGPL